MTIVVPHIPANTSAAFFLTALLKVALESSNPLALLRHATADRMTQVIPCLAANTTSTLFSSLFAFYVARVDSNACRPEPIPIFGSTGKDDFPFLMARIVSAANTPAGDISFPGLPGATG